MLYAVECEKIHQAIHDPEKNTFEIAGKVYPIEVHPNGCRFVEYEGVQFMEQNKSKNSAFAKQAREGKRITWGIRSGNWIYIDDTSVTGL